MQPRRSPALLLVLAVLAVSCLVRPVHAQDNLVDVQLDTFGTGAIYRPGTVTAVRLKLTATFDEPTSVWVQWEIPNVDGDTAEYGRTITLSPGQGRLLWLYAPVPPQALPGTTWPVRVYALNDGARSRELGGTRISAGTAVRTNDAMIAIIGSTAHLGLRQYAQAGLNSPRAPFLNEFTQIVSSITPTDLPDRWEGWSGYEAVVWSDADPSGIASDQANALREYVRRGGHFIITLPQVGNPWALGTDGRTLFSDLLPSQAPRKDENTLLSDVVSTLTKADDYNTRRMQDFPMAAHIFKDLNGSFDATDNRYEPLIALPDGRVIVIRRNFGHGWITLIGIDLAYRRLYSVPLSNGATGIPQADAFWNRILGRRVDTPTAAELTAIQQEELLSGNVTEESSLGRGTLFMQQISMSQEATIGLLAALLLFAVYWVVAGPGGFYALKFYKQVKFSWLAFAGAAAIFTATAWGIVGLIRQNDVAVKHVTVLDHIYRGDDQLRPEDPQYQRAVSWFSIRLPGYGPMRITIEPTETDEGIMRDLLYSWTPPGLPVQQFPNTDRYRVEVGRQPAAFDTYVDPSNESDYALPARSTSTVMYANWLGGLQPEWGGLFRIPSDDPIRVTIDATGRETSITGSIISELPGDLTDITFIWVLNARSPQPRYQVKDGVEQAWVRPQNSQRMPNLGAMTKAAQVTFGGRIDLAKTFDTSTAGRTRLASNIKRTYIDPYLNQGLIGGPTSGAIGNRDITNYMEMLSLYNQLDPPTYLKRTAGGKADDTMIISRDLGRELDLSIWLTRPCLIILGYLRDSELPIPLRVNGRMPVTEGDSVTLVRWIYPLPIEEEIAFSNIFTPEQDDQLDAATPAPEPELP